MTSGAAGCADDRDQVSSARAGSRTSSRAESQPSSASASSTEVAVAPPPSTTADPDVGHAALGQRGDRARDVGVERQPPLGRRGPPCWRLRRAGSSRRGSRPAVRRSASAAWSGRARARCRPGRRGSASSPSDSTLDRVVGPVQAQLGVRRPVQGRGQRVGDRRSEHGATHGLSSPRWSRQYSRSFATHLLCSSSEVSEKRVVFVLVRRARRTASRPRPAPARPRSSPRPASRSGRAGARRCVGVVRASRPAPPTVVDSTSPLRAG